MVERPSTLAMVAGSIPGVKSFFSEIYFTSVLQNLKSTKFPEVLFVWAGETDRHTHTRTKSAYRKFSTVPLRMSFEGLRQENPRVFRVMLPLIFPGVLIS